ncbi:hypothetical protein ACHAWO_008455 [Cyclotella atomus]|uniref:Uncharacterized protein n=1 Tax=Cyclotella atomus TaxID=382360 RepID=A0ABD3QG50_9STRA
MSRPPAPLDPSLQTPLVKNASIASRDIFVEQTVSVLRSSAVFFLKRHTSQMIQIEASKLPSEILSSCHAALLTSKLEGPLKITRQDVVDAETFAKNVGIRWEKVLRRRGYAEWADTVNSQTTAFSLFTQANASTTSQLASSPSVAPAETEGNEFVTVDAALSSTRRHHPDCDGSGNASQHISTMTDLNSDKCSSVKNTIEEIDGLMENLDSEELRVRHGYNWNAINEAVIRNEKRLYIFQKDTDQEDDECEIVPKSLIEAGTNDANASQRGRAVRFEERQLNTTCKDILLSTNVNVARVLGKKRKRREKLQIDVNEGSEVIKGRLPSNIGEMQWNWQEILDDISISEQHKLLESCIHPRLSDQQSGLTICGALRPYGSTHLWEQTYHQEKGHNDTSAKRTLRKAAKERAGTRTFEKKGDINEETEGKTNTSKAKWTEDCTDNNETSSTLQLHDKADQDDPAVQQELRHWLELDLGECAVEMPCSNAEEGNSDMQSKRILAFRSLELALRF